MPSLHHYHIILVLPILYRAISSKEYKNTIYITGVGRTTPNHLIVNYRKEEIATRQSEVENTMENSIFHGLRRTL